MPPDPRPSQRFGAVEFRTVATSDPSGELPRLLALPRLPTARSEPWHAVASVLLATPNGRVLLARNRRGWGTVGGHVEPEDETLRAAACREVLEEVGLDLDPDSLEPLAVVSDAFEFRPGCRHADFCFVVLVPDPVDVTPASDVSEAAWFDLDDCPPVNEHIAAHLRALRVRLDRP